MRSTETAKTSGLKEIIERVEKCTGPDRVLDAEIMLAITGKAMHEDSNPADGIFAYWEGEPWKSTCHNCTRWSEVTSSLDAVLALVEDVRPGHIELSGPRKYLNIPTPVPNRWRAELDFDKPTVGWGPTAPLALLSALLRSVLAQQEQE